MPLRSIILLFSIVLSLQAARLHQHRFSSHMEGQLPVRDFTSLELSHGTATILGANQDYAPRNVHKRPWPFAAAADDRPHSSASVRQPAEPLYLLGSIVNVQAQLRKSEYEVGSGPALFFPPSSSISLGVSLKGDYFELHYSGQAFARLNKSFCGEACRLAHFGVEFRAYLQKNIWEAYFATLNNFLPDRSAATFAVDVNVYSFRHHADRIGDIFSQAGFFLQYPTHDFADALYYNPQVLEIEGFKERQETSASFASESTLELVEPFISVLSDRAELEHQRNGSDLVDSIFNSLSHHEILHEIHTDQNRIRTELLPHQMKAIDFIRQREDSNLPLSLSLWKEQKLAGEETYFRHALTGTKRPRRDETKGGIIADDMGLGKTLVVLSAIASSLNMATEFVSNHARDLSTLSGTQRATRATLVLAPSTLLIDSWIDEIRTHTYSSGITFHKHLGPERHKEEELKLNFEKDVVFTTFATVASELIRGNSPLAKIYWFRIVLDEAHEIRNRSTKQFQAVHGLTALQRWCLTGTPIQNSLEDLGALISFLRVPILDKAPTFRRYIIGPTTSNSRNRYRNLQTLLQTVCLRRTKDILGLPEVVPEERLIRLSDRERREYDELFGRAGNLVQMAASGHRSKISATVLHCIHELRLFCNNGSRRTGREIAETDDELLSELQQHNLNNCANCSGPIYSIDQNGARYGGIFISSCKHLVCYSCLPQCYKRKGDCVLCSRGDVPKRPSYDGMPALYYASENGDLLKRSPEEYPSKLQALLNDLRGDTSSKCIVFSSWKKTLDLAAQLLELYGMRYDVIHGGLSLTKRLKVLGDFKSPTGPSILLMTLGTGAVGLNLAVASRIYILEPQWNPFIEFQAMARAQRLGQTKQVVVIRYIMQKTIEQHNVLNKQRKKAALAWDGFGKEKLCDSLISCKCVSASARTNDIWQQYFGIQPGIR